jgi:hypothetical protein
VDIKPAPKIGVRSGAILRIEHTEHWNRAVGGDVFQVNRAVVTGQEHITGKAVADNPSRLVFARSLPLENVKQETWLAATPVEELVSRKGEVSTRIIWVHTC